MGERFNTAAGWALFAGIIALGGAIVSSKFFHEERPEKMGYAIEGVEARSEEHTSELQSLMRISYAVFCLKKKKKTKHMNRKLCQITTKDERLYTINSKKQYTHES